jgi:hypothetical protein
MVPSLGQAHDLLGCDGMIADNHGLKVIGP